MLIYSIAAAQINIKVKEVQRFLRIRRDIILQLRGMKINMFKKIPLDRSPMMIYPTDNKIKRMRAQIKALTTTGFKH